MIQEKFNNFENRPPLRKNLREIVKKVCVVLLFVLISSGVAFVFDYKKTKEYKKEIFINPPTLKEKPLQNPKKTEELFNSRKMFTAIAEKLQFSPEQFQELANTYEITAEEGAIKIQIQGESPEQINNIANVIKNMLLSHYQKVKEKNQKIKEKNISLKQELEKNINELYKRKTEIENEIRLLKNKISSLDYQESLKEAVFIDSLSQRVSMLEIGLSVLEIKKYFLEKEIRDKKLDLNSSVEIERASIISETSPTEIPKKSNIPLAVASGLFFGILWVFFADWLRKKD